MRTLITHGTVVTASDTFRADVLIDDEIVTAIGESLDVPVDRRIGAAGQLVLPGGIDVHTHLDLPVVDFSSADDFESGTIAAACGGTTTIIDYATQFKGDTLLGALDAWRRKADGKAAVDYGFHMAVTDLTPAAETELDRIVAEGVTSFKVYMAYPGALMLDDGAISRVLARAARLGALVCVHAENGPAIAELVARALAAGHTSPRYHALTRPVALEREAVGRAIALAEVAGAPVYVVHLSSADGLEEIHHARARGAPVFAETCPQYLLLSDQVYEAPAAECAKYVMSPPLRPPVHQNALWAGLARGDLQVVATDHCPFRLEHKNRGRDDFSRIPNGAPGIETRLSLIYDSGVRTKRLTLNRFVDVMSTAPAKIFGLYPRKGTIAVGSDADLVIFDPARSTRLSAGTHHMRVDYSAYEGWEVSGVPTVVLSRGRVVVEHGAFVGRAGHGRFVRRTAGTPVSRGASKEAC
jgi:dihydropyrimidinase